MLSRLFLLAAIPAALAPAFSQSFAAVPQSFSLRVPDLNPNDSARLLAADSSGSLFVVSTSPKTSAIVNIHVVKTDAAGKFIAAFDFGGSGIDTPHAAAVDPQGNLIVAGTTQSMDFPMVSPLLTTGSAFVTKINPQLSQILFSTRLGTVGGTIAPGDVATAVAVDGAGNIYIAGSTSNGFPTTPGVLQPLAPVSSQSAGVEYGFVTELSAAGDRVIFSTYFAGAICTNGGSPCIITVSPGSSFTPGVVTIPSAIAVDSTGAVTIAGTTSASDLPVSAGAYATQCGCTDAREVAFIARIGAGGTKLEWGTYLPGTVPISIPSILGGGYEDTITSLALDASGNVVFAGTAKSDFPISTGALVPTFPSSLSEGIAGYIAKLDSTGSRLLFSTWFGGYNSALGAPFGPAGLAIDKAGNILVTGSAVLGTLPAPSGTPLLGENYIAGLSPDGSSVLSLFTVPAGGAGEAIQSTAAGAVDVLGTSGALLVSSPAAGPSLLGLAGSASYTASGAVAPRELISLYGIGLGPSTAQNVSITGGIIANSLGGVEVLFDGIPAPLLYAGPTQINTIVPTATVGRETTTISIVTPTGTIAGPTLPVAPTQPEVFAGIDGFAIAVNQDGTLNSAAHRAPANSIVSIWLTGGGAQSYTPDNTINTSLAGNPNPVSILASNNPSNNNQVPLPEFTSLEVLYAGDAPGQPSGVIQVNFLVPAWPTGNSYQVQIGAATEAFSIWAQ